jgi:hypothetical protein
MTRMTRFVYPCAVGTLGVATLTAGWLLGLAG